MTLGRAQTPRPLKSDASRTSERTSLPWRGLGAGVRIQDPCGRILTMPHVEFFGNVKRDPSESNCMRVNRGQQTPLQTLPSCLGCGWVGWLGARWALVLRRDSPCIKVSRGPRCAALFEHQASRGTDRAGQAETFPCHFGPLSRIRESNPRSGREGASRERLRVPRGAIENFFAAIKGDASWNTSSFVVWRDSVGGTRVRVCV